MNPYESLTPPEPEQKNSLVREAIIYLLMASWTIVILFFWALVIETISLIPSEIIEWYVELFLYLSATITLVIQWIGDMNSLRRRIN